MLHIESKAYNPHASYRDAALAGTILKPGATIQEQWLVKIQEVYESVAKALLTCWLTIQYYIESPSRRKTRENAEEVAWLIIQHYTKSSSKHQAKENARELTQLIIQHYTHSPSTDGFIVWYNARKIAQLVIRRDTKSSSEHKAKKVVEITQLILRYDNERSNLSLQSTQEIAEYIFQDGKVIGLTRNRCRLTDIPEHVRLRKKNALDPHTAKIKKSGDCFGVNRKETDFQLRPSMIGKCLGSSMLFCKDWLETGNIEETAEKLKDGIPLDGVIYQDVYIQFSNTYKLDRIRATCRFADLNLEKVIYNDATPQVVAQGLSSLNPGTYIFGIPTYNFLGQQNGTHALSLIIDDSRNYYFLDPNYGIGTATRVQSSAMFNRIYRKYGNYSEPLFNLYRVDQYQSKAESP